MLGQARRQFVLVGHTQAALVHHHVVLVLPDTIAALAPQVHPHARRATTVHQDPVTKLHAHQEHIQTRLSRRLVRLVV